MITNGLNHPKVCVCLGGGGGGSRNLQKTTLMLIPNVTNIVPYNLINVCYRHIVVTLLLLAESTTPVWNVWEILGHCFTSKSLTLRLLFLRRVYFWVKKKRVFKRTPYTHMHISKIHNRRQGSRVFM